MRITVSEELQEKLQHYAGLWQKLKAGTGGELDKEEAGKAALIAHGMLGDLMQELTEEVIAGHIQTGRMLWALQGGGSMISQVLSGIEKEQIVEAIQQFKEQATSAEAREDLTGSIVSFQASLEDQDKMDKAVEGFSGNLAKADADVAGTVREIFAFEAGKDDETNIRALLDSVKQDDADAITARVCDMIGAIDEDALGEAIHDMLQGISAESLDGFVDRFFDLMPAEKLAGKAHMVMNFMRKKLLSQAYPELEAPADDAIEREIEEIKTALELAEDESQLLAPVRTGVGRSAAILRQAFTPR